VAARRGDGPQVEAGDQGLLALADLARDHVAIRCDDDGVAFLPGPRPLR